MRAKQRVLARGLTAAMIQSVYGVARTAGYQYDHDAARAYLGGNRAYLNRFDRQHLRVCGYGRSQPRHGLDYRNWHGNVAIINVFVLGFAPVHLAFVKAPSPQVTSTSSSRIRSFVHDCCGSNPGRHRLQWRALCLSGEHVNIAQ